MSYLTLSTLALAVLLAGCATAVNPSLPPTVAVAEVAYLPTLPRGARLVVTHPVVCRDAGMGMAKGYDTNGNGDYDVAELWREGMRLAILYYDALTEQQVTHAYVQEGTKVVRYTREALLARYPNMCDLMAAPRAT